MKLYRENQMDKGKICKKMPLWKQLEHYEKAYYVYPASAYELMIGFVFAPNVSQAKSICFDYMKKDNPYWEDTKYTDLRAIRAPKLDGHLKKFKLFFESDDYVDELIELGVASKPIVLGSEDIEADYYLHIK
jgi:hypothetical protein